jgi:hypothetical protein
VSLLIQVLTGLSRISARGQFALERKSAILMPRRVRLKLKGLINLLWQGGMEMPLKYATNPLRERGARDLRRAIAGQRSRPARVVKAVFRAVES